MKKLAKISSRRRCPTEPLDAGDFFPFQLIAEFLGDEQPIILVIKPEYPFLLDSRYLDLISPPGVEVPWAASIRRRQNVLFLETFKFLVQTHHIVTANCFQS